MIDRTIAELPKAQATVITMCDIEGFDPDEICNVLDISLTNQRVLLHRARSRVRQALDDYMGDTSISMKLSRDLTCAEVVELVTEYLEGGLSPARARALRGASRRLRLVHDVSRADAADDRRAPVDCAKRTSTQRLQDALIDVFRGWKTE